MKKLGSRSLAFLIVALLLAVFPATFGSAQKHGRFPVIVVFEETAPFTAYRGSFQADRRVTGHAAAAWGYLDEGVLGMVQKFEGDHGFHADQVYSAALEGFAASLTAAQIQELEKHPDVKYVVPDDILHAQAQILPWGIDRVDADISSTQAGNGSGAVTNVNVFVIDTGVGVHADLNRVAHLNFTGDGNNNDCNGHGTHLAGIIAARDNTIDVVGVAPGAPITGVKVLGCAGSGSTSNVIKGVDWVTANAAKPAVANMSLGGPANLALDDAVRRSVASGVFYAVVAGSSNQSACNFSPGRAGAGTNNGIATVAATDMNNRETSFTNFGPCIDLWAPGLSIPSTKLGGGTVTFSGTSMATAHVTGSAALFLSSHTVATPRQVESNLKANALDFGTKGKDGRAIKVVNVRNF